ncbi:hypothetical protein [Corynebacterium halotolerans]|uniref:Uncharacterized protein n=1 Tax=Corynebacterium halotolerans YIM 70093 = DSM 44683 TaxID=1121362 RepID=M1MUP1_9CORY|nr:hypothetical protein [Corynebacterium halotolerans]AGF71459.1 hypothetical protein A605_02225 [Corynebacterium halotolerans YIM 70093 = DSM 44683]
MSTSVFDLPAPRLLAARDQSERRRLEWFYTEVVVHLVTFPVDHALAIAEHHITHHGVPEAASLSEMRQVACTVNADTGEGWLARGFRLTEDAVPLRLPLPEIGGRMPVAALRNVYLRADVTTDLGETVTEYEAALAGELAARRRQVTSVTRESTEHYRRLTAELPLEHPELLGNLWRIGLVADLVDDDAPLEDLLVSAHNRRPFITPVSPGMTLDEAWYTLPLQRSLGDRAMTTICDTLIYALSRPVWRWTSPDHIHRIGGKHPWAHDCAAYVLCGRLGIAHRPTGHGRKWWGHYEDPASSFDPSPGGDRSLERLKLDWDVAFRRTGQAEVVLRGEAGVAAAGQGR